MGDGSKTTGEDSKPRKNERQLKKGGHHRKGMEEIFLAIRGKKEGGNPIKKMLYAKGPINDETFRRGGRVGDPGG